VTAAWRCRPFRHAPEEPCSCLIPIPTKAYSTSWSRSPGGCLTGTWPWPKTGYPTKYVPWRLGRDFDTEPWTPDQPRLTGVAQAAFEVNLLTEDNLPSYHHQLLASFGPDGAWNSWSHRWTAEEGRHAIVLRDNLLVTRNLDPVALERGRMATLQQGWMPDKTALGLLAYAAFQELATRISHRNTGRYSDDPVADKIMVRVAADENLPMMVYRDLVAAAL
jgi:acyl-[acyl-carrier-protein] desaturase